MRSTDLPYNNFVHMPPPLEEEMEIKIQKMKNDLIETTDEYIKEEKGRKSYGMSRKYKNLTEEEGRGLGSIQQREDLVVFQTDKSGRLSADTKENYVQAALPHIEEDREVGDKEHDKAQKEINAHTNMWLRFSRAGENGGAATSTRIKNSMRVNNHGYASCIRSERTTNKLTTPY